MESNKDLINYIKGIAPKMSNQEIINELKRPHGKIDYDINLLNHECQQNQLLSYIETETQQQILENQQKMKEIQIYLGEIVKKWSQECAKQKKISEGYLKNCSAILLPYGSVLLGVANTKSDIDLICVAPAFIDRKEQFFEGLFYILSQEEGMEQINKIEQTSNPIIKMIYKGFHIDMSFASLNSDKVPENIDENLDILRRDLLYSEDKSMFALNGRKNGILISKSIPDQQQFVQTLRLIKCWSKRRKVASNIIGYLGGISWAILTAKICQLFPKVDVCLTLKLFFKIYSLWNWKIPIIIDESDPEIETFKQLCWKKDDDSRNDKMQIITPAYPYFNTTFKVNQITYLTITSEFYRASQLLDNVDELFQSFDFFQFFQYFVVISIVSKNKQNFHKWTGFCEAQLPKLLKSIINHYGLYDNSQLGYEFRITPEGELNLEKDYSKSLTYFLGLKKIQIDAWPLSLRIPITKFAIELLQRKQQNFKNEDDDFNMKIYMASSLDIEQLRGLQSPQSDLSDYDNIRKKNKIDDNNGSAQLVKRISFTSSIGLNQEIVDDLF